MKTFIQYILILVSAVKSTIDLNNWVPTQMFITEVLYPYPWIRVEIITSTRLVSAVLKDYYSGTPNAAANTAKRVIFLQEDYPEGVRQFLLYHEMGHIVKSHFIDGVKTTTTIMAERAKGLKLGQVMAEELEADAYAAANIGSNCCIAALQKMGELAPMKLTKREIGLRIEALKAL